MQSKFEEFSTPTSSCCCCHSNCEQSRRSFLKTGAAVSAGVGLLASQSVTARANSDDNKYTVKVFFALNAPVVAPEDPNWPHVGFDFRPHMDDYMVDFQNACPEINFVSQMCKNMDEAHSIVNHDTANGDIDGYIVMQMNAWNRVVNAPVNSRKPTLYTGLIFGGDAALLIYGAGILRDTAGKWDNFGFMQTSSRQDILEAVKCFNAMKDGGKASDFGKMITDLRIARTLPKRNLTCKSDPIDTLTVKETLEQIKGRKLIRVNPRGSAGEWPELVKKALGIDVIMMNFKTLQDEFENADPEEVAKRVKSWKETARTIELVSDETLEKSARIAAGMKKIVDDNKAMGITIDCLGGFYSGALKGFPCLGFVELLNSGLVGACECDLNSSLTMIIMTTLTKGRPGFISDPIMDSATRQIVYAHCVATTKVFGPNSSESPYHILTHSEDRNGASVRSILPLGYMTTTLLMVPDRKSIVFHQAKTVANCNSDRACRTKLCGEPVGDFEKLFTEWDRWGWHRVTYYGDLKKPVFDLAEALGWEVVEEA